MRHLTIRSALRLALGAGGFLLLLAASAADVRCTTCGKAIQGRYIAVEDQVYCSRQCHQVSLPACATCNRAITGRYLRHLDRDYCSQRCLDASLPTCVLCGKPVRRYLEVKGRIYCEEHAKATRCDACGLPMEKGWELPDKRRVCPTCHPRIVLDEDEARAIYQRAGREVERFSSRALGDLPPLKLVGREAMPGNWQDENGGQERGFYRHELTIDTYKDANGRILRTEREVKETVHILYGLSREELLCTAAHELGHVLQERFLPHVHEHGPAWLKEGICQYLAAAVARRHGYADELESIERSPHPAYGRGYRYLQRRFGNDNWPRLHAWLETLDPATLPAELPPDRIP